METRLLQPGLCGILFLLIIIPGYRLNRAGKPYPGFLFNLHKLLAVGTAVFLGTVIQRLWQAHPAGGLGYGLIGVMLVLTAGIIATGGLTSIQKQNIGVVQTVHKWAPYLVLLCTSILMYMLIV